MNYDTTIQWVRGCDSREVLNAYRVALRGHPDHGYREFKAAVLPEVLRRLQELG